MGFFQEKVYHAEFLVVEKPDRKKEEFAFLSVAGI